MAELIWKVKGEGDTIGGVISCVIKGCPIGLGQPVFGKLHAALGNAMLSINAVKGFAYGQGFDSMELRGSEQNDVFYNNGGRIETKTNYSGGIQGGISNGQDIYFRVAFKPVATVLMEQHTVNINGIDTTMKAKGRHDPCVLPRAVPIVEAMAAITVFRLLFDRQNHSTIKSVFIKKPKEPNSLSASLWTFYICIFLYLSFIIFSFLRES